MNKIWLPLLLIFFSSIDCFSLIDNHHKYFLRWVTTSTQFPIKLHHETNGSEIFKWFKYYDHAWIDNLPKHLFKSEQTATTNSLEILSYDKINHQQLDHYESRLINDIDEVQNHTTEAVHSYDIAPESDSYKYYSYDESLVRVYTLAHLNTFDMMVLKNEATINISCVVTLLLPLGQNDAHTKYLNEQIMNRMSLNLQMPSEKDSDDEIVGNFINHKNKRSAEWIKHMKKLDIKHRARRSFNFERYLLEIEISYGPLTIFRTDQDDELTENLTCTLGLVNIDGKQVFKRVLLKKVQQEDAAMHLKVNMLILALLVYISLAFCRNY
jgi:hypothetical protein